MCQSIILSAKGNTTVSYCRQCHTHYIWQNSYLLTFNSNQYTCFLNEIKAKKGAEEYVLFPDGDLRLLLTTPVHEILFTFTAVEWADFTGTLDEAYYMREIYQLIH